MALAIFERHSPKARTAAEHDQFWVYGHGLRPGEMGSGDRKVLEDCGWEWDESIPGWRKNT